MKPADSQRKLIATGRKRPGEPMTLTPEQAALAAQARYMLDLHRALDMAVYRGRAEPGRN